MSIVPKMPSENYEPNGVGMVLYNHLGSTSSQDTGRDAQHLADSFGVPVLAVDRPGTNGFLPNRNLADQLSSVEGYLEVISWQGEVINEELEGLGVETSIVAGRSAGGIAALALTASQVIETQGFVFAAEPISCEQLELGAAKERRKEYETKQRELRESNPGIVRSLGDDLTTRQEVSRRLHMVPDFFFDRFHNQYIWASDASTQYMRRIAAEQQQTGALIEFAEHSLVASPDVYAEIASIEAERTDGAAFVVRQSQETTHASYDNREFIAKSLGLVVKWAVAGR